MGIIFWFVVIFIVSLLIKLSLFIFREKVDQLTEGSKLLKYIRHYQNFEESLYNYLAVTQIISMTSMTLYLRYEYIEKGCLNLDCFRSDV